MTDFADKLALRAYKVRAEVLKARRQQSRMTGVQVELGYKWVTEDAFNQRLTVTMSFREAVALVRVIGPLDDRRDASQIKVGGPAARFLAAIHVVRQAVFRAPAGGLALSVALEVLQVALDDLRFECSAPPRKIVGKPR